MFPYHPIPERQNINIPLYTIQGSNIQVPINLNYPEVALVKFDSVVCEQAFRFAKFGDAFAKSVVKLINCLARNTREFCSLFILNIKAKKTNYLTSFMFRNVRESYTLISHCPIITYKDKII